MWQGCACCLLVLFAFIGLGLAIEIWDAYWPIFVGLGLSWVSLRYLRAWRNGDDM